MTDFGVEASLANCHDCVRAFLHWLADGDQSTTPPVDTSSYLLPLAVHIPGWGHLWGNIAKHCTERMDGWPAFLAGLRTLVRFLRVHDYRMTWSSALKRLGVDGWQELEKPFKASFLHWRWETLAAVCKEIARLHPLLTGYFDCALIGKVQDTKLLHEFGECCADRFFMQKVLLLSDPLDLMERTRLFGTWCACCDLDSKAACLHRGRRLHQAASEVDNLAMCIHAWGAEITLEECLGSGEMLQSLVSVCSQMVAEIRLRFQWLRSLPYILASCADQATAEEAVRQFDENPGRQHRCTIEFMSRLGPDLRAVAQGGPASRALKSEQQVWRLASLTEASIEGYHAQVAKEVARARHSKLPSVFSALRANSNFARLKSWARQDHGKDIICHEWNRFKRVVKLFHTERSGRPRFDAFVSKFYRLRADAAGDVHLWCDTWSSRLAEPLGERTAMQKMRREFLACVLPVGTYVSLPRIGDQPVQVYSVVGWYTGQEKLVDISGVADMRDLATLQPMSIWREDAAGAAYPPRSITIYMLDEPRVVDLQTLIPGWSALRESMFAWSCSVSDVEGCFQLDTPVLAEDAVKGREPMILKLETLRESGWKPHYGRVQHSREDRLFGANDVANKHDYVEVLLNWDRLPHAHTMKSGGCIDYYRCLLAHLEVPFGYKAKVYAKILKSGVVDKDALENESFEDDTVLAPKPSQPEPLADLDVVLPRPIEDEPADGADSSSSSSSSSSSAAPVIAAALAPPPEAAAALAPPPEAPPPEAPAALAPPRDIDPAARGDGWPDTIDGATCKVEDRPGAYHRLRLKCKWHEDQGCRTSRVTTMPRAATVGRLEAISYLAVWHRQGRALSCHDHQHKYRPTWAEQEAWIHETAAWETEETTIQTYK